MWRMISQKSCIVPLKKAAIQKLKLFLFINEPVSVVTVKSEEPAEESQIEAVNEGNQ
jgi:hypothetical protein